MLIVILLVFKKRINITSSFHYHILFSVPLSLSLKLQSNGGATSINSTGSAKKAHYLLNLIADQFWGNLLLCSMCYFSHWSCGFLLLNSQFLINYDLALLNIYIVWQEVYG